MMSFRLSSEAAESGFPEKSSGDADNAPDPESPRDTPCGRRDKRQNKTHISSFNPKNQQTARLMRDVETFLLISRRHTLILADVEILSVLIA
jgi:hypothetical protein